MAVFEVNFTTGPEGILPILLMFGAMKRLERFLPVPEQVEREKLNRGHNGCGWKVTVKEAHLIQTSTTIRYKRKRKT